MARESLRQSKVRAGFEEQSHGGPPEVVRGDVLYARLKTYGEGERERGGRRGKLEGWHPPQCGGLERGESHTSMRGMAVKPETGLMVRAWRVSSAVSQRQAYRPVFSHILNQIRTFDSG